MDVHERDYRYETRPIPVLDTGECKWHEEVPEGKMISLLLHNFLAADFGMSNLTGQVSVINIFW